MKNNLLLVSLLILSLITSCKKEDLSRSFVLEATECEGACVLSLEIVRGEGDQEAVVEEVKSRTYNGPFTYTSTNLRKSDAVNALIAYRKGSKFKATLKINGNDVRGTEVDYGNNNTMFFSWLNLVVAR